MTKKRDSCPVIVICCRTADVVQSIKWLITEVKTCSSTGTTPLAPNP